VWTHSGVAEMCNSTETTVLHASDLEGTAADLVKCLTSAALDAVVQFGVGHSSCDGLHIHWDDSAELRCCYRDCKLQVFTLELVR
jgi:hypothetical protein